MQAAPRKELSLFDSICLIVGIIVGAGIYETSPTVAGGAGSGWGVLAFWVAGGLLSLAGALCYAELATAYPKEGGDYVYLSKAYGRWAGFLFGWVQLVVVRPGDIALMAFVFARYGRALIDPGGGAGRWAELGLACLAVVALTAVNAFGVRQGKWTQNVLTVVKALGLLAILGVALFGPRAAQSVSDGEAGGTPVSLALILVLFTFGGWNEIAYVAAEVKNPRRNIVRALAVGLGAVTLLYVLANAAFLYTLGHAGMVASDSVATDTVAARFPALGGRLISALVCISALGAVNGLVFSGARITYALGREHRVFGALGRWDGGRGTPIPALAVQAAISVVLILVFGSFNATILYTAATVYAFYCATSLALLVLRRKDPGVERPFRVIGYPLTPLVFAGVCLFLIQSALRYDPRAAGISLAILAAGLPVYWLSRR